MSRYVDADALGASVIKNTVFDKGDVIKLIETAPSIEIIRCGECKHWKSTVQMPNGTEVKCLYGRKADDFCSYGEVSEKPTGSERSSE